MNFDLPPVYFMRFIAIAFLFFTLLAGKTYAQQDSSVLNPNGTPLNNQGNHLPFLDSVAQALQERQQFVSDSMATMYIRPGSPLRRNQLVDSLFEKYLYKGYNFLDIPSASKSILREGHSRQTRDQWVILMIIGLLFYTAILNRIMSKDFESVWQSFYNKRTLTQVSREDSGINSWTFIGLFLLFGLTFGLFLYQLALYYHVYYSISGVRLFVSLSLIILILFAIKFLVVKFLGFVFNINKLVSEYLSILYLTYFNIAFVFLPVTVCFSMLTDQLIPYILAIALILIVIIFTWQYLRSSVNIISNMLFHKFYLFVYLCALEICPILILIKALNI
ncbi:MAG: hypothetical protein JWQ66_618 [Mucilaginibacter sp.]|nr:hypothetical protein [Mucilaginibacter sp.]